MHMTETGLSIYIYTYIPTQFQHIEQSGIQGTIYHHLLIAC